VLRCAQGLSNRLIAQALDINEHTVGKWRDRFIQDGVDGLLDAPRSGAPRTLTDERVAHIVKTTLESAPKDATHWSTRSLARSLGESKSSIARIWRAFGLQPHRCETFKLSTDPLFVDKVRDIVGLYMNPPERALVLCVDEKTQIQALARTQPLLPLRPGQPQRRTHDYKRHGTTSLFAALDAHTGHVIGQTQRRPRTLEFLTFLGTVEQNVPPELDVHLILDNYGTHKTQKVRRWLAKRPRFHVHFTPTSSSWLNLVERFFALLTQKQLRRGVHRSVSELEAAVLGYIAQHNESPKPFIWTKTADAILETLAAYCQRINDSGH
jgi:transposase